MSTKKVFSAVPTELDFPRYEAEILRLWKEKEIFEKSIQQREGGESFVFYEGPPTANGVPHNGHVLTRVSKDIFPRFQAMRGKHVLRKGGWDTHGLPVEVEVEKSLRIHGKEAIQEYGVRPFVRRCIESVFKYTTEWEKLTEKLGFWVSLPDAYVTYHKSYVESVWWSLSELFKKGLLYQGHKVIWWWAQGGTALSSAEVGQGYKTVKDPSVYCLFPLVEEPDTALVVWTTTPWTLPSNGYAAVKEEFDYVVVTLGEELPQKGKKKGKAPAPREKPELSCSKLIIAEGLRETISQKLGFELVVEKTLKGSDLVGKRYEPPFDFFYKDLGQATVALKDGSDDALWWRVLAEDFVTLDSGTGIVHIAPAFGEDDHNAHKRQLERYASPQVDLICAIKSDGTFKPDVEGYAGLWVKDADPKLIEALKETNVLLHSDIYEHEYPFCWRAMDDPLIQLARPGWFVRTTRLIEDAKANNRAINWLPEHIKTGRFGDFLENNVDWALSRERFWGTPLNVWQCSECEHMHAPSSVAEIEELNPNAFDHWHEDKKQNPDLNDHLMVHKPWIDAVTLPCEKCGGDMKRVPEVIDCWYDSGSMPFAQWGFPHVEGSAERFDGSFPADFISEAIDQTRGWFYTLLMISTLVFDEKSQERFGLSRVREFPHPYKTCIVLGHVSDKDGKKESKSKGNYTPPDIILDRVKMDFAVMDQAKGKKPKAGQLMIALDDLEGMDLKEGASVSVFHPERPDAARTMTLHAFPEKSKIEEKDKFPRRIVLMADEDRAALGLKLCAKGLEARPVEVPDYPAEERLSIFDPNTSSPGADAFRWFFFASGPPWNNTRHSLRNVRLLQKDFHVKLRNVYSFFTIYANIDGWSPSDAAHAGRPVTERSVLDRWLISELALTTRMVADSLEGFQVYDAAVRLIELAESLSNWYVRRSRSRFWAKGLEQDKCDAYATLYEALVTLSKLIAPFIPFFADEMYQNLVFGAGVDGAKESVHLEDFPQVNEAAIDEALAAEMAAVREIVSLGLAVRTSNKLKVRQPLSRADVVFNDRAMMDRISSYEPLILEELNVHELHKMHPGHEEGAVSFKVAPNFRALGPRLGKRVQEVKQALGKADGNALFSEFSTTGKLTIQLDDGPLELSGEEVQVSVSAAEGFAALTGKVGVVVIHTTLTEKLIDEGYLREVVSRVQAARKDAQLEFTDRITLQLGGSERLRRIAEANAEHIKRECLATELSVDGSVGEGQKVGEEELSIALTRS